MPVPKEPGGFGTLMCPSFLDHLLPSRLSRSFSPKEASGYRSLRVTKVPAHMFAPHSVTGCFFTKCLSSPSGHGTFGTIEISAFVIKQLVSKDNSEASGH
jgi:hypothetical protein